MSEDPKDCRETPAAIFEPLHEEFSFTIDVAASRINHKVARYCSLAGFHDEAEAERQRGWLKRAAAGGALVYGPAEAA